MVKVSSDLPFTRIGFGAKASCHARGPVAVSVAAADAGAGVGAGPGGRDVAAHIGVRPAVVAITSTFTVHEPLAGWSRP